MRCEWAAGADDRSHHSPARPARNLTQPAQCITWHSLLSIVERAMVIGERVPNSCEVERTAGRCTSWHKGIELLGVPTVSIIG